jgi:YidC/Oxa1 family membrane protein insertase
LQIPVFIALYQTLESAVQLRQQSFAWIADLSQPDVVAVVFGLSIHPLAIAMTLLMLLQQLLTPMSVDGMQRRMMLLMPVVMLFVLYNLPAGLTLYWTVSSIFSIGQMLLQRKLDGRRNRPAEGKK